MPRATEPWWHARVECPHCGEAQEISIEADVEGEMVRDCEVCCRPWQLDIRRGAAGPTLHVEPAD